LFLFLSFFATALRVNVAYKSTFFSLSNQIPRNCVTYNYLSNRLLASFTATELKLGSGTVHDVLSIIVLGGWRFRLSYAPYRELSG
jgi:hypothetical protein